MEKPDRAANPSCDEPASKFTTPLESVESPFTDETSYVVQLRTEFERPEAEVVEDAQPAAEPDSGLKKAA